MHRIDTQHWASKISLNPEYLWTERGPEMHTEISQASNGEAGAVCLNNQARSLINGRFEVMSVSQLVPAARAGRASPAGRRSREAARRGKRVEFTLTDGEFADLDSAASLAGLSRGAYAAQAALAVARGGGGRAGVPLPERPAPAVLPVRAWIGERARRSAPGRGVRRPSGPGAGTLSRRNAGLPAA